MPLCWPPPPIQAERTFFSSELRAALRNRNIFYVFFVTVLLLTFNENQKKCYAIQCLTCDVPDACDKSQLLTNCLAAFDACMTIMRYDAAASKLIVNKECSKMDACLRQQRVLEQQLPCHKNSSDWGCVYCCRDDICNKEYSELDESLSNDATAAALRQQQQNALFIGVAVTAVATILSRQIL